MRILYLGDIMGDLGVRTVAALLPDLRRTRQIDLVIAQAENVTDGHGMLPADMVRLQHAGVDFFSGGNHTPQQPALHPYLENPAQPVIGPANMTACPGRGWKYLNLPAGNVLIVSLLGHTVGREIPASNPLRAIDTILALAAADRPAKPLAIVVNLHGDYSSEKVIIGHYLDGRASMVVGDHWHVQTADGRILPGGTAHITDVGMCGALDSSLGVAFDSVIPRWRDEVQTRNRLVRTGAVQLCGLLAEIDPQSGLARQAEPIRLTRDHL